MATEEIQWKACGPVSLGTYPKCMECLENLACTVSGVASRDPEMMDHAEAAALEILEAGKKEGLTSPELAGRMIREIRRITGVFDPYLDQKTKEMRLSGDAFQAIKDRIALDLHSVLATAAVGNSLDFFKPPDELTREAGSLVDGEFSFFHDDSNKLNEFLGRKPENILYLADNAGEIYFDQPLYRFLAKHAEKVVLAVKAGPALNDLTRQDLENSNGLRATFGHFVDTGADGPGVDWEHVSPEFLDMLNQADLVLSKGMANFETLYGKEVNPPVFFVFKAKCDQTQEFLSAPPNSYWALWQDGTGR